MVCPLGLEVQKIHACPNDYILYRNEEYENLDACPICGALRNKMRRDDSDDVEGERPRKKGPAKVMWYAPIIPRLKCFFKNKEHTSYSMYLQPSSMATPEAEVHYDASTHPWPEAT